ncbi:unnamed protein product [Gongylonema pulchrum]|uniref:C2H2-type domain-containing protein n=1 Tax=Gongylonema pulchrum TaxID=637853 RepID=A0A183EPX0_9BILA|nr:unnamed protein product [Gongylonema pulchrum]
MQSYLTLLAFLRLVKAINITNPTFELINDRNFVELVQSSYLYSLFQIAKDVSEAPAVTSQIMEPTATQTLTSMRQAEMSKQAPGTSGLASATKFAEDWSAAKSGQEGLSEQQKSWKKPPPRYQCEFRKCQKNFKKFEKFCVHLSGHNELDVYRCNWPNCGILLPGPGQLLQHYVVHAEKEVGCRCHLCGCPFVLRAALKNHYINIHKKSESEAEKDCQTHADKRDGVGKRSAGYRRSKYNYNPQPAVPDNPK